MVLLEYARGVFGDVSSDTWSICENSYDAVERSSVL